MPIIFIAEFKQRLKENYNNYYNNKDDINDMYKSFCDAVLQANKVSIENKPTKEEFDKFVDNLQDDFTFSSDKKEKITANDFMQNLAPDLYEKMEKKDNLEVNPEEEEEMEEESEEYNNEEEELKEKNETKEQQEQNEKIEEKNKEKNNEEKKEDEEKNKNKEENKDEEEIIIEEKKETKNTPKNDKKQENKKDTKKESKEKKEEINDELENDDEDDEQLRINLKNAKFTQGSLKQLFENLQTNPKATSGFIPGTKKDCKNEQGKVVGRMVDYKTGPNDAAPINVKFLQKNGKSQVLFSSYNEKCFTDTVKNMYETFGPDANLQLTGDYGENAGAAKKIIEDQKKAYLERHKPGISVNEENKKENKNEKKEEQKQEDIKKEKNENKEEQKLEDIKDEKKKEQPKNEKENETKDAFISNTIGST